MDTRLEVLKSIEKVLELDKDVRLGLYLSYVTSADDLNYITDEEFKRLVDDDIRLPTMHHEVGLNPGDKNIDCFAPKTYSLTKENERIAYERYKASKDLYFPPTEKLSWYDFLQRFPDVYNNMCGYSEEDFDGWSVINHVTQFYGDLPHRYVPMWVVARKGDKYTCLVTNSYKIPDAFELFEFIRCRHCLHYSRIINQKQESLMLETDEYYALVFDYESSVRSLVYPSKVYFGMAVRPDKKEYEIYEPIQAVEVFHEMFVKCDEIIK